MIEPFGALLNSDAMITTPSSAASVPRVAVDGRNRLGQGEEPWSSVCRNTGCESSWRHTILGTAAGSLADAFDRLPHVACGSGVQAHLH